MPLIDPPVIVRVRKYEEGRERGGWWPVFTKIGATIGAAWTFPSWNGGGLISWFSHAAGGRTQRILPNSRYSVIHCEVVPLPEEERERERDLFTIYVCTSRIKFDGRPRKKVFPNPQRDLSARRHEFLADDRTSQVWHCPLFSAFVDERSLEPTKFRWISNLWERFEYHVNVSKFFFFFLLLWWSRDTNFILVALYLCGRSLAKFSIKLYLMTR